MSPDIIGTIAGLLCLASPVLIIVLSPLYWAGRAILRGDKNALVYDGNLCNKPLPYGDRTYEEEARKKEELAKYEKWLTHKTWYPS